MMSPGETGLNERPGALGTPSALSELGFCCTDEHWGGALPLQPHHPCASSPVGFRLFWVLWNSLFSPTCTLGKDLVAVTYSFEGNELLMYLHFKLNQCLWDENFVPLREGRGLRRESHGDLSSCWGNSLSEYCVCVWGGSISTDLYMQVIYASHQCSHSE